MDDDTYSERKGKVFETWWWRKTLKILWTEKAKTDEIHLKVNGQKIIRERRKNGYKIQRKTIT